MEYQKHLDIGASKSFMSKSQYLRCKSLHSLQNKSLHPNLREFKYGVDNMLGFCLSYQ